MDWVLLRDGEGSGSDSDDGGGSSVQVPGGSDSASEDGSDSGFAIVRVRKDRAAAPAVSPVGDAVRDEAPATAAVPSPTPSNFVKLVVSYGAAFPASSSSMGGGLEHSNLLDETTIREAIFGAAGCSQGAGIDDEDTVTHEEDCEHDGTGSSVEAPPTSSVLGTTVSPCNALPVTATVVEFMENSGEEDEEDNDDEGSGEEEDSDDYNQSSCEEDVDDDESSSEEDDTETSGEEEEEDYDDDDESSGEEEEEDTEISGDEEEDSDVESSSEDCFEIPATRQSTNPVLEPTANDANDNVQPSAFHGGGTYDGVDGVSDDDIVIPSSTMCTHNTDQATAMELQLEEELFGFFPYMCYYCIDCNEDDDDVEGSDDVEESSKPSEELAGRVYDDVDSGSDVEDSVSEPSASRARSPFSEFLFDRAPKSTPRDILTRLYGCAGRSYDGVDGDSDDNIEDEKCCEEEDVIVDCSEEEVDNGDGEEIGNVPGVCGLCGHTVQISNGPVELGSISDYDCFDPETVVRPAKVICKNGKAVCIVYDDDEEEQGVDNPMPEATGPSGGAEAEHVDPVRSYDDIDTDTEDGGEVYGGHNAVEEAAGASDTAAAKRGPAGNAELALEYLRRRAVAEDGLEVEDVLLQLMDFESHAQERAGQRGAGSATAEVTSCFMVYVAAYLAMVCFSTLL